MAITNFIVYILSVAVTFLAFDTKALKETGGYDYVKFGMHWPRSYCNSLIQGCQLPIVTNFTISKLVLMYEPNTIVKRYNSSECSAVKPRKYIDKGRLGSELIVELSKHWQALTYKGAIHDEQIWENNWERSGKCFDNPNQPKHFFETAIKMATTYDILTILRQEEGIVPDYALDYDIHRVTNAMNTHIGKRVIIECNQDIHGVYQLYRIHICWSNKGDLIDCYEPYTIFCGAGPIIFPMA